MKLLNPLLGLACLIVSPAAHAVIADRFDYPIGNRVRYTEANDGDGWYVAQEFGEWNSDYFSYHLGEDWNAESGGNMDCGLPVYAVANATIVYADIASGWGRVLIVRHTLPDGSQVESLYGHLSSFAKTSGEVVRGEQVGTIGDGHEGGVTYPCHLHLEIRTPVCPNWGQSGPGYSPTAPPAGWFDPSEFLDAHLAGDNASVQWLAYNDHNTGAGTATYVSTYSLGVSDTAGVPAGGPLIDFATGQLTAPNQVGVSITSAGLIHGVTGTSHPPNSGTPADRIFGGKVDWTASSLYFGGSGQAGVSEVRLTFTNLHPSANYAFRGTAVRGSNYVTRWTLATLAGAASAKAAHSIGAGSPGIVTNGWAPYGDTLSPVVQAAWNSGDNRCGDVIGWDDIIPIGNSFSVICSNWTEATPGGSSNTTYCYAFSCFALEQVLTPQPVEIRSQPTNSFVKSGDLASFAVEVAGWPVFYQRYKDSAAITGSTNADLTIANATTNDAGTYFVIVSNQFNSVTSSSASLTVFPHLKVPLVSPTDTIWKSGYAVDSCGFWSLSLALSWLSRTGPRSMAWFSKR